MERGWMGWLGSRLIHYVWYNPRVERAPLSQTSLTTTHRPVSPRIHIFPTQKPNPLCQSPFIPLFCERIITRTPSSPPVTATLYLVVSLFFASERHLTQFAWGPLLKVKKFYRSQSFLTSNAKHLGTAVFQCPILPRQARHAKMILV